MTKISINRTLNKVVFLLLFCSFIFELAYAQVQNDDAFIRQVSSSEGLNAQSIYDLYINADGLLFLGTNKGLISYNGIFFKNYAFQNNLALSVTNIQEDSNGNLWCKNFSDQLFYFENDSLKAYLPVQEFLQNQQENLVEFTFYQKKLHLLTENNLYVHTEDNSFQKVFSVQGENHELLFSMYKDENSKKLYLASNNHIYTIQDNQIKKKIPTRRGQKDIQIANGELIYIIKGNENQLVVSGTEVTLQPKKQLSVYFYALAQTDEAFWLCTSDGVYEVNTYDKKITHQLLNGKRITDIVKDKEGNHWLSSLDHGLFFMPNRKIKRLQSFSEPTNDINTTTIHYNDANAHLYIGTSKGEIVEYDEFLNPIFVYQAGTNIEVESIFTLEDKLITSVGIFQLGKKSPVLTAYFGKDYALDDFGNLVVANYNIAGIISANLEGKPNLNESLKTKELISYGNSNVLMHAFRNKRARAVHYKQNEGYYIGFSDGLYFYGIDGSSSKIQTSNNEEIVVVDFFENNQNELWVASSQQGLLHIENAEVKKQFTTQNGLSSNKCRKIQSDDNGVWVITDESLDFYSYATQKLKNFGNNLGLNGISLNDFYVNNTFIWFATNKGVLYFPKTILNESFSPFLEITAFQNDGLPVNQNDIISYFKNDLKFNFNGVLYKSLGNYTFEYKLEPFQTEWQTQDARQTQLNFVTLKPDSYQLKARIKAGSLISPEVVFPFEVSQPVWKNAWFILLIIVSLSALLATVYNWAVRRTQKKQRLYEMLAVSQLTALRSQMNPHFMFNVLNAIQGLIYSNQKNKANEYIGTFSTLMRKTLAVSEKREVSIADEIETIKLYVSLEKARFEDDEFTYLIELPKEDLSAYTIPSLIIQPFVENAIKHGLMHKRGIKKLVFKLSKKDKYYWCFVIEDNGVGRKTSAHINQKINKKHASFATNAIATRIELINKLSDIPIEIQVEDLVNQHQEPTGTKVTLYIPIKRQIE